MASKQLAFFGHYSFFAQKLWRKKYQSCDHQPESEPSAGQLCAERYLLKFFRLGALVGQPGMADIDKVGEVQAYPIRIQVAVSLENNSAALNAIAEITNTALLANQHAGLELGRELAATLLSDLGDLLRSAPTLRVALEDFAAHQSHFPPGSVVYLIEDKDQTYLGYAVYQPDTPGSAVLCDCVAMALLSLVRLAGTDQELILGVVLSRSAPKDSNPYRQAFAVDFRFNAEQTAVVLSSARLDHALPGTDATLRNTLVARFGAGAEVDTVTRLRRLLRVALLKGKVSANQIALQLGMSRRTLHRRLDAAGVHYQEILDQTRCAFAQQLLADTSMRIGEIATIVGYTDPSALTRRFIRWTGIPPNEWRSNLKSSKA